MPHDDETVSFENAKCIAASPRAIYVQLEDREEPIWIPQSQVHLDSEVWEYGQEGTLVIRRWFAELKELV